MNARSFLFALGLGVSLAGCGGGGEGGSTPQGPSTVNTGLSAYLPLATNNSWTFASGARIVDQGSGTLTCSCAYNGGTVERQDLFSTTGAYSGSFFYAKASGIQGSGSPVTYIVATSTDQGQTATFAGMQTINGRTSPGLGIMDDSPSNNETFSDGAGDTATISNVGETVTYGNNRYVNNATVTASYPGALSVVFTFARGVGYTSISYNGQTTTLANFSVSSSSSSIARRPFTVRAYADDPHGLGRALQTLVSGR